jgi:2-octaprenyl-6-methoxyphenol hydroxylase
MTNIVILGAGLSGEITALAFAAKGIKTLLLEVSDLKFPKDGRTIALTNLSKSFLAEVGIWSSLEPYISDIKDVYVADDFSPRMMHLSESQDNYKALGYMIESYNLRSTIHDLVLSNPLITLKISTNYELLDSGTEGKAILQIADKKVTADLIVICDGRNSKIRKEYFVDSFNKDYKQSALTFHVEHTKMHENTAVEHFMNRGVFAILPLRNQHQSAIVWAEKSELAEIYKDMEPADFLLHLKKRFGDFLGDVKVTTPIQSYPLTARITKHYYYDKLLLVADSAHNIHPLAGQGLNQGIKDIESLSSIVARNYFVGLEFDKLAAEEYERSRKGDNYAMFLLTDNLNRIFSNNIPILRNLRKVGLSMIDRMSFLKKRLVK